MQNSEVAAFGAVVIAIVLTNIAWWSFVVWAIYSVVTAVTGG